MSAFVHALSVTSFSVNDVHPAKALLSKIPTLFRFSVFTSSDDDSTGRGCGRGSAALVRGVPWPPNFRFASDAVDHAKMHNYHSIPSGHIRTICCRGARLHALRFLL